MNVELALKHLLLQHGVPTHGAISSLATHLGLQRQAVSKIVNGRVNRLSYKQIAGISSWLLDQITDPTARGELRLRLPGALFRFSALSARMLEAEELRLFIGERTLEEPEKSYPWISGSDADVALRLVHSLTGRGARFRIQWHSVPLHLSKNQEVTAASDSDVAQARDLLRELRPQEKGTALVIGSQKVNLLMEFASASFFASTPFSARGSSVPYYTQHRSGDPYQPISCFGGPTPPSGPRATSSTGPGIYFRDDAWRWVYCPWKAESEDAGVVLVADHEDRGSLTILLFGFSGPGTRILGRALRDAPDLFWPEARQDGSRMGAYAVSVSLADDKVLRLHRIRWSQQAP